MTRTFGDFTQVNTVPGDFLVGYRGTSEIRTTVASLSDTLNMVNFNSAYTTVNSLSDSWDETGTIALLQANSASWDATVVSVFTNVSPNTAAWNSTYSNVLGSSASWNTAFVNATVYANTSASYATTAFVYANTLILSAGGNITNNTTVSGTLSCTYFAADAWSPAAGAAAGNYLNITVAGSAYRIPLYLVS